MRWRKRRVPPHCGTGWKALKQAPPRQFKDGFKEGIPRHKVFSKFFFQKSFSDHPPRIGVRQYEGFMKTTRSALAVMTLFAADTNAGTQEQLAAYRHQIDSLDQRIVELIQQRARAVEEVGNIKREAQLPVPVPNREQQVIGKAQELAKCGPLPAEAVGRIYQKLVEEMRNWEATLDAAAPRSPSQSRLKAAAANKEAP